MWIFRNHIYLLISRLLLLLKSLIMNQYFVFILDGRSGTKQKWLKQKTGERSINSPEAPDRRETDGWDESRESIQAHCYVRFVFDPDSLLSEMITVTSSTLCLCSLLTRTRESNHTGTHTTIRDWRDKNKHQRTNVTNIFHPCLKQKN